MLDQTAKTGGASDTGSVGPPAADDSLPPPLEPRQKPGRPIYGRFRRRAKQVALWFRGVAGFLKGIATFAGALVAIGFCVLIGIKVFSRTIAIEPLPGPKLMVESGFSPEVTARRLRDALAGAEAKARTTMRGPEVSLNNDLPDITVPARLGSPWTLLPRMLDRFSA